MTRTVLRVVPLLALVSLAVLGCGVPPADANASVEAPVATASADGSPAVRPFEVRTVDGQPVEVVADDGTVRLLVFWATWCAPCREEIPMLNDLHAEYGERGFELLAISDEKASVLRAFAEKNAIEYANLVDPDGEVHARFEVVGVPFALLVDGEGRIRDTYNGKTPRAAIEPLLRELLSLPPQST